MSTIMSTMAIMSTIIICKNPYRQRSLQRKHGCGLGVAGLVHPGIVSQSDSVCPSFRFHDLDGEGARAPAAVAGECTANVRRMCGECTAVGCGHGRTVVGDEDHDVVRPLRRGQSVGCLRTCTRGAPPPGTSGRCAPFTLLEIPRL